MDSSANSAVLEALHRAVRQEKERNSIQIGKETVKLPLFAHDLLYRENPEDSTEKLLHLTKPANPKPIYKNLVCFYALGMHFKKKELIPFIITSKRVNI